MIVVPYTKPHDLLKTLLRRYGFSPSYIDVSEDAEAYWRLLKRLWQDNKSFVLIEHDILPWPGAIEELRQCPGSWCAYSYDQCGIGLYHSFGCTKFSAGLIEELPDIWTRMNRHWSQLDQQFEWLAFQAGIRPHHHRPAVIHLHDYSEPENLNPATLLR
jgi:hypothetical protein